MVLLVVDTQKGIVDERLYAFEKFVSNIRELRRPNSIFILKACRLMPALILKKAAAHSWQPAPPP